MALTKFGKGLVIQQVGAKRLQTRAGTRFRLGGGVFTEKEIIRGRKRFGKTFIPKFKAKRAGF